MTVATPLLGETTATITNGTILYIIQSLHAFCWATLWVIGVVEVKLINSEQYLCLKNITSCFNSTISCFNNMVARGGPGSLI